MDARPRSRCNACVCGTAVARGRRKEQRESSSSAKKRSGQQSSRSIINLCDRTAVLARDREQQNDLVRERESRAVAGHGLPSATPVPYSHEQLPLTLARELFLSLPVIMPPPPPPPPPPPLPASFVSSPR